MIQRSTSCPLWPWNPTPRLSQVQRSHHAPGSAGSTWKVKALGLWDQEIGLKLWLHFPLVLPEQSAASLQASVPLPGRVAERVTGAHAYSAPGTRPGPRRCTLNASSPCPPTAWLWVPIQTPVAGISSSGERCRGSWQPQGCPPTCRPPGLDCPPTPGWTASPKAGENPCVL